MSLSEKLIIAAKNGSTREVRKLLGRGALFTKDQVLLKITACMIVMILRKPTKWPCVSNWLSGICISLHCSFLDEIHNSENELWNPTVSVYVYWREREREGGRGPLYPTCINSSILFLYLHEAWWLKEHRPMAQQSIKIRINRRKLVWIGLCTSVNSSWPFLTTVWQHRSPWGSMEWKQWYCKNSPQ